jgi:poly(3-hydroxybutyrate) depolymerase
VLIVAPLSGHYATLLRDTVRTMLKDHKVYITDWKNARLVPLSEGEFHLDDYVNYVQEFIRHLQGNLRQLPRHQRVPAHRAGAGRRVADGQPWRDHALTMTMMGGPIDARKSPTAVNNLATNKQLRVVREQRDLPRAQQLSPVPAGACTPAFLQHTGFVAMNPDRHATSHYDYFKRPDQGRRRQHRSAPQVLRRVQRRARHGRRLLPGNHQDRVPGLQAGHGTWDVRSPDGKMERVRPQDITTTALLTVEGELDDISGSGQTEAAHDLCTGIVRKEQRSTWKSRARATTASSVAAAGARWCTRRSRPSSSSTCPPARQPPARPPWPKSKKRPDPPPAPRAPPSWRPARDPARPRRPRPPPARRAAADAVHPLRLPRLRRLCPGHGRGRSRHQPVPARRRRGHPSAGRDHRPAAALPLDPAHGTEGPRAVAWIDEDWCIGCTLCIKACPVDCIVGTNKRMHTVIEPQCTGCELCIPACPVDCIHLDNVTGERTGWDAWSPGLRLTRPGAAPGSCTRRSPHTGRPGASHRTSLSAQPAWPGW